MIRPVPTSASNVRSPGKQPLFLRFPTMTRFEMASTGGANERSRRALACKTGRASAAIQVGLRGRGLLAVLLITTLAVGRLAAVTLGELVMQKNLTPKKFASYFEDFEYEFSPKILPAEVFLSQRRGDCDDYAVLADHVLGSQGHQTRLIHVRLVGRVAHAVCYVTGTKGYLDYNNRKFAFNVERSGASLREIATKVAKSFEGNWTSVSEFTYTYDEDKKHFGVTVVKTDASANDPDRKPAAKAAR